MGGCGDGDCRGKRLALQFFLLRHGRLLTGDSLKRRRVIRVAEVTIETEENIVLRKAVNRGADTEVRRVTQRGWCATCQCAGERITPLQAAQIAGTTEQEIHRWVESGTVHVSEAGKEVVLVRGYSLMIRRF